MRINQWDVYWVEDMPQTLETGKLYISVKHCLTEHRCACGCGVDVSLPIGKSDWWLLYDGDTISLWPSVGNWRLPCRSHYLIKENRTIWCPRWTDEQILEGRNQDRLETLAYIRRKNRPVTWLGRLLAPFRFSG